MSVLSSFCIVITSIRAGCLSFLLLSNKMQTGDSYAINVLGDGESIDNYR